MAKLVGRGSRTGSTPLGRLADGFRRPPTWWAMAGLLAAAGPRAREAALRGGACYLAGVLAHMPLKAVIGRSHPKGAGLHSAGPFTSSFPSGHAASDVGFTLGVAQVMPVLAIPLSAANALAGWSLLRTRGHYPSDLVAGAALAGVVAVAAWKWWPPPEGDPPSEPA